MGTQNGGGSLKREIGTSDECFRCGIDLEEKGILCPDCRKVNGMSFLLTGDLPHIMVFGILILVFILFNYGPRSSFYIPGTDIDGKVWGFLFLAIAGIFVVFQSVFNWRYLIRKITYKTIFRTISPTIISIPIVYFFTYGMNTAGITVSLLCIVTFILVVVFNRKMILRSPRADMILLLLFNIVTTFGVFSSINGIGDLWSIESLSMAAISAAGLLGVYLFSLRVNVRASILARRSMTYVWTLIIVLFTMILILLEDSTIGSRDMALLWYVDMAAIVIGAAFFTLKRSMDWKMLNVYTFNRKVMRDLNNDTDLGHSNYKLNLVDNSIRRNPVHGLGDIPQNGNILFKMEGGEGEIQIIKPPDEFVKAHWEKGRLLASTGKYKEALREYETATSKGSDHYRTYYHRANLRSVMHGESRKAREDMDMYLASRRMYISRFVEYGLMDDYMFVFSDLYDMYSKAISKKMELLRNMGISGDASPYFTLSRED